MKKLLSFTLFLFIFANTVFAQSKENVSAQDSFSFSTYALIQSRKSGGGISFALPLYQKGSFVIKDEISLNLYLSNPPLSNGLLLGIENKLHFGSLKEINGFKFRTYGYMKCILSASSDENYSMFNQAPFILELGGAGGFEFLYSEKKSFFAEFGGGASIADFGFDKSVTKENVAAASFDGGYVCLTLGAKHYF